MLTSSLWAWPYVLGLDDPYQSCMVHQATTTAIKYPISQIIQRRARALISGQYPEQATRKHYYGQYLVSHPISIGDVARQTGQDPHTDFHHHTAKKTQLSLIDLQLSSLALASEVCLLLCYIEKKCYSLYSTMVPTPTQTPTSATPTLTPPLLHNARFMTHLALEPQLSFVVIMHFLHTHYNTSAHSRAY